MQEERKRVNELRDDLEDKISHLNKTNKQNTGKITEIEERLTKSKNE